MTTNTERLVSELHQVMGELEGLFKASVNGAGEYADDASRRAQSSIAQARRRMEQLERELSKDLQRSTEAAGRYVRENPWTSIAVTAAAAFLVGLAVARRG